MSNTLDKLSRLLGGFDRLAGVIPNAPSIVNAGFNPVAYATNLPAADRDVVWGLLRSLGESPEVRENQLEAYAVLTAPIDTMTPINRRGRRI